MDEPWLILSRRYGGDVRNPTAGELALAIEEQYVENLPGMTEADYEEHGAASLRYGFDDGPMYVLEVSRGGAVTLEEWADQDYQTALSPRRSMASVPAGRALELWRWLAEGAIDKVRHEPWSVSE
jgi:hypothetical protein